MNDFKRKIQKNNSFNNFSIININQIMNKTYNKNNKGEFYKINNFKTNKSQNEKYRLKRISSSQTVFLGKNNGINNGKNMLGQKNENFYCKNSIYSAPSMKDNRLEITRLYRSGKYKSLSYVNNIHNSIMIKHSKLYRKKLKSFSKDNSIDNSVKSKIKKKYNINNMNDFKDVKIKLDPNFKFFCGKKNKRNFSSYESSLNKDKSLNLDSGKKSKTLKLNENSLNSNKTNYFSKYLSGKSFMKTIYELKNNHINNETNLTNSTKIFSANSTNKKKNTKNVNKNKNNYYYFLNKKPLLKNQINLFLNKDNEKSENKNENMIKEVQVSKMSFELNDMLFNKKSNNEIPDLVELEKKLITFKTLKSLQKNRLQYMSNQDIIGHEKRILLLDKSIKKYNMISIDYFKEINNYISFLKDKRLSLNSNLDEENNKRFNLYFDIEKLVNESILKQKELEYLVEIRYFLIQVKNSLLKQPHYFQRLIKETSRKIELGKLILGLKVLVNNQNVARFLDSIPEIKNEDISQDLSPPLLILSQPSPPMTHTPVHKASLKKRSKNYSHFSSLKNRLSDNNINKYIISEKLVFDSPEEFIILLDNIESKNLRLIRDKDYIKRNITRLQKEYDDLYRSNLFLEKFNDLNQKEEKLKKLKEENVILNEKYKILKNKKNAAEEDIKNKTKNKSRGFYLDINIFRQISYYNMLENYQHKGLLLLEKLLYIIKDFINLNYSNYGINKAQKLVGRITFNKLWDINKKNINKVHKTSINEYILYLLKIYENICEYIKSKDVEYNSNKSNKFIIHQKKEEINLQRKINNTKLIRQLAEEKRINGIENIAKRNNELKIIYKLNYDDNIVKKNIIKKMKKKEEIGKYRNKNLEKEYNFYVSYDEE